MRSVKRAFVALAGGSLTLYIHNKSPAADKQSNWLPAPNGPIYKAMRL
jgi:hypothetical protein